MIVFNDKMGIKRALEFSLSYCGNYINETHFTERREGGNTIQIPIHHIDEIIEMLNKLKEKK